MKWRVLLDDRCCASEVQKRMAERALRRHAPGAEILLSSRTPIETFSWAVKPWVRDAVAAKRWVLTRPALDGLTVYLDAHGLARPDFFLLAERAARGALSAGPGRTLAEFSVMAVDHEQAQRMLVPAVRALDVSDYRAMAGFEPDAGTEEEISGCVADYRRYGDRPWYFLEAPDAAAWCAEFAAAWREDPSMRLSLQRDIESGACRPSLAWQAERGQADPALVLPFFAEVDADFRCPEAVPSAEEGAIMRSREFARRIRRVRFENVRRIKGGARMAVSIAFKKVRSWKKAAFSAARRLAAAAVRKVFFLSRSG